MDMRVHGSRSGKVDIGELLASRLAALVRYAGSIIDIIPSYEGASGSSSGSYLINVEKYAG